jgi:hypothetical protein
MFQFERVQRESEVIASAAARRFATTRSQREVKPDRLCATALLTAGSLLVVACEAAQPVPSEHLPKMPPRGCGPCALGFPHAGLRPLRRRDIM